MAGEPITEREKFESESAFRAREIAVKEQEVELRRLEVAAKDREFARSRWTNPLVVAIFAAALAATGNAVVAYMGNTAQRDAIHRKAEADLILDAIKPDDDRNRALKLEFLVKMGLVSDPELPSKIEFYIANVLSQKSLAVVPTPSIAACDGKVLKSFDLQSTPALDGNNYNVGIVGPMKIDISQRCENGKPGAFQYVASYGFYNGSGTWRGSQEISLTFKSGDGKDLQPPISFALDRSRCVYGGAQARRAEGILPIDIKLISAVTMSVSRVQGVQTPC